ncbi:hypothetical protein HRD49_21190 [Corallococcus exiguus]|uniref:hypothetical protein n=1 Tax=Corallococcus TaxID=83461 RepID=UPI0011C3C6AE|nr:MULTISPECIES: hypothetical protein [Corallococcus]NRD53940.1 hypothetical protein [Corallococcus exiguus]NRD64272.1 hypothetical protein [Corallococcus exiguus]
MPEDDWRPQLTVIEAPIADDYWRYTTPEGKRRTSRLTVGRPVHFPQERCWYTPVMIEGHLTKVTPIFGQGPVDALMNAMMFIRRFNDEMREVVSGVKPRKGVKKATRQKTRRGKVPSDRTRQKTARSSSRANR